jgi:hypothetical protein
MVRRRANFKIFERQIDQYAAKFLGKGIEKDLVYWFCDVPVSK